MQINRQMLIAVVGASTNSKKYGYKIFRDLFSASYNAVPVNLKGGELLGQPVFKNLTEIKSQIDLVVMVVPPTVSLKILPEIKNLGIKQVWFQPGSESAQVIAKAEELGLDYISNACLMVNEGLWDEPAQLQ